MIVARRKPFAEIMAAASDYRRVLVLGCGTCVAVCLTGGEKEAGILAAQLDIAARLKQQERTFDPACVERQCDREFLDELAVKAAGYDAILSLACGAGIQFLAERFPDTPVLAGVDTTFIGVNEAVGVWDEKCRACRTCYLTMTGGICPVTLCPKGMLNGPCGGTRDGRCETDPDKDCVWTLIYQRLERTGRLTQIMDIVPPRSHAEPNRTGRQIHPAYQKRYRAHD